MPIQTNCPTCKAAFKLPDNLAGKKVRCAKCQQIFEVPVPPPPPPPEEEDLVPVELVDPPDSEPADQGSQDVQPEPRRLPPRPAGDPLGPPKRKKASRPAPRPRGSSPGVLIAGGALSGVAMLAVGLVLALILALFKPASDGNAAGPVAQGNRKDRRNAAGDVPRPREEPRDAKQPGIPPGDLGPGMNQPGGMPIPPQAGNQPGGIPNRPPGPEVGPPGAGLQPPPGGFGPPGGGPGGAPGGVVGPAEVGAGARGPGQPKEAPRGPGPSSIKPPAPVPVQPPALDQDKVVRELPSTIGDVVVGGGGRFLVLTLPQLRKIAIFDVNEAKVATYLPIAEDNVKIAAGMDKLMVALPTSNVLQRWNLLTGEREVSAPMPLAGTLTGMCMGSASNGPLLMQTKGNDHFGGGVNVFLDPATLKEVTPVWQKNKAMPSFTMFLTRASADGKTFGMHDGAGGEPHALKCIALQGDSATLEEIWPGGGSLAIPTPDGRYLCTTTGILTPEFKPLMPKNNGGRNTGPWVPARQGPYLIHLEPASADRPPTKQRPRPGDAAQGEAALSFHLPGDERPLAKLTGVEGVRPEAIGYGQSRDKIEYDKRINYIPAAKVVVTIPPTDDKLILYRFDIDEALEKSDIDYLVVTSQPPPTARKGQLFQYQLVVKSKKGGVKYKLESGPNGMRIDAKGMLNWQVPPDAADAQADVIITVSDATGQELFHTFKLSIAAGAGVEAAQPERPPVAGKEPPAPVEARPKPAGPEAPAAAEVKPPAPPAAAAVVIKPPTLDKDQVTRELPSTVADLAVGGGGRYLILYLAKVRKLGVFDVNEAKVVHYIPLTEDGVKFAAGLDKLFIAMTTSNVLQRWNLTTFEREVAVPLPVQGTVQSLTMGCASNGPLLLVTGDGDRFGGQGAFTFFDTQALKKMDVRGLENQNLALLGSPQVRASVDGKVLGLWSGFGSSTLVWEGNELKAYTAHNQAMYVLPGPDGRVVYTSAGMFTNQWKPFGNQEPGGAQQGYLPALQGNYYLRDRSIFMVGDSRPLVTVKWEQKQARPEEAIALVNDTLALDKRFHFIPAANLIVFIPPTNDRLQLIHLDVEEAMEKADIDYLLVTSQAPATARKGDTYAYQLAVKSKKGGVAYRVESGPKGMTVDNSGKLTWAVPRDFADAEADVILTVKDRTGQEVFHTFKIGVQ
jgi:predicted Zn finger-like uncharacterized protein